MKRPILTAGIPSRRSRSMGSKCKDRVASRCGTSLMRWTPACGDGLVPFDEGAAAADDDEVTSSAGSPCAAMAPGRPSIAFVSAGWLGSAPLAVEMSRDDDDAVERTLFGTLDEGDCEVTADALTADCESRAALDDDLGTPCWPWLYRRNIRPNALPPSRSLAPPVPLLLPLPVPLCVLVIECMVGSMGLTSSSVDDPAAAPGDEGRCGRSGRLLALVSRGSWLEEDEKRPRPRPGLRVVRRRGEEGCCSSRPAAVLLPAVEVCGRWLPLLVKGLCRSKKPAAIPAGGLFADDERLDDDRDVTGLASAKPLVVALDI